MGCRVSATPGDATSVGGAANAPRSTADDDDSSTGGRGGTSTAPSGSETAAGGSKASDGARGGAGASSSNSTGGSSTSSGGTSPSRDPDNVSGAADAGAGVGDAGAPGGSTPIPSDRTGATSGCDAQAVSFDEIRSGEVRSNVKVRVDATATSQKFLLSHARSGSCLFAAFVGIEPDAAGPRGLLVVSYGDDAPTDEACPTTTDAIPADLSPGDTLRTVGYLESYAPSGCSATPSPQLVVDRACPLERSAHATVPEPFELSDEQADALAQGTDSDAVRRLAGGLVRLEHVSALRAADGTGSVAPYGVVALAETKLEIHNDLEYDDLTLGGPGDAQKSLVFAYPTAFTSVTGLAYLDYCTWALTPRSRCDDLVPASANCEPR